jgi:hypothetical protein
MFDKQEYYHGAAIIRLCEDARFKTIAKHVLGYIVNGEVIILLKYSTKSRTPWLFTFTLEEMVNIETLIKQNNRIVIALVCGGDGVCAIHAKELYSILGDNPGWLSIRRKFKGQYGVAGPNGHLERKVSFQRWPSIIFESIPEIQYKKG